jgi:hypothetical protein
MKMMVTKQIMRVRNKEKSEEKQQQHIQNKPEPLE